MIDWTLSNSAFQHIEGATTQSSFEFSPERSTPVPTEVVLLRKKVRKLAKELCRQSRERQVREKKNDKTVAAILEGDAARLDISIRDLGQKFGKCCPFKIEPEDI
jgi:hypothetical protein